MTTLRIILEEALSPGEIGRYSAALTREIVATAPRGAFVEGFVAASTEPEYRALAEAVPGLTRLHKSALARRELRAAWQHGFTRIPGGGMMHALSALAPLARHDRINDGEQIVVTFHHALAWTHPELLPKSKVSWIKAMAKRAERFADAIVVPSHSTAAIFAEEVGGEERLRVIAGASGSAVSRGGSALAPASTLELPERYIVALDGARHRVDAAIDTAARLEVPLVLIDADADRESTDRVFARPGLTTDDIALVLARAALFIYPGLDAGFGVTLLDAMGYDVPVVHSDRESLEEITAGAALTVPDATGESFTESLVEAVESVLTDESLADRLRLQGGDRARAYTWRGAAEKVWQLHADL